VTTKPNLSRLAEQARAVALWARDSGLGGTGFLVVLIVALAGWAASFIGLHNFGMTHMSLTHSEAWLVPITFDGAPAGLSIVVMRASTHGRSALLWRLLIIAFTALSSWINYQHIDDSLGRSVAAFMPPAAVILFEGLMSEARHAAQRRGGSVMERVHPLRWFFDRKGTLDLYRRHILGLPVPKSMATASATPAAAGKAPATASRTTARTSSSEPASPTTATPVPAATASREAASPALPVAASPASAIDGPVYLPDHEDASPGTTSSPATASPEPTATPEPASPTRTATKPAVGTDQRDLDQVADTYRALFAALGRTPSDSKLAEALGVGRSRAQQLRTAAIEAGHADLAKPVRAAS
jgi:hypothetical protein